MNYIVTHRITTPRKQFYRVKVKWQPTKVEETVQEPVKIEESHPSQPPVTAVLNGDRKVQPRPSNEIKMVSRSNGAPKDVIRANDPPEDDLPKNIGVNKFVNFFESLGGKK